MALESNVDLHFLNPYPANVENMVGF